MSPQAQKLYQTLLSSNKPLSATNLASKLKIAPQSLYRLANSLIETGFVTKSNDYPHLFSSTRPDEALSLFLLHQSTWFLGHFQKSNSYSTTPSFSFIQSRDELMNLSTQEVNKATKSVDLLRSGEEFPADLLLAIRNAQNRGVTTRMLIQDYSKENKDLVKNWQQNGILVRKTPLQHLRLMIYDSQTVYFMSYRHSKSEKDLGLKINYPPFATVLQQQFEQWWKDSIPV